MEYEIRFSKPALDFLKKISKSQKDKTVESIKQLSINQHPQGYTKLEGLPSCFRIRVGDYRIVYTSKDDILIVIIVAIGHRKDIYKIK